jgi:DNA-binding PadR family transcriptional regulator
LVLALRYGLEDGHQHSLARIGRRLGVSAERVRQLEARALERLDAHENAPTSLAGVRRPAPTPPHESPGVSARQRFLRPWTLLLLWLEPAHGADVKERLIKLGMPGADYRFLRRLEAEGLLDSTWAPGGGIGPDRRIYSLTDAGLEQLERDAEGLLHVADTLAIFFERRRHQRAG